MKLSVSFNISKSHFMICTHCKKPICHDYINGTQQSQSVTDLSYVFSPTMNPIKTIWCKTFKTLGFILR